MALVPPIPQATLPKDDSEWRFHDSSYPSEWVEMYRPGGFHPVNLGDTLKDGQYQILRKLGYGSFSTVWLARDKVKSRYVALKVMEANASFEATTELSILDRIKLCRSKDPLSQYILINLDAFQHSGPNGTHLCLASEPMGPTLSSLAEELTPWQEWTGVNRYPKSMAKRILRHTLLGLKFLHSNGIVHADLQPGNIISTISNIDEVDDKELQQDLSGDETNPAPEAVRRLDGLKDEWAPSWLYLGQSLVKYIEPDQKMQFKISDFGAAFWAQDPPNSTVTPTALRSPEQILGGEINSSIDIWSFGCLIYELLTGIPLFPIVVYFENHRESADDDHLLQMNDILEPLPDIWLQEKWPRAGNYFGPKRERLHPNASDDQAESYIDDPLEVVFKEHRPNDIDDAEASVITSLIRSILRYDASQRPTAEELLKHPWFQD